MMMMMMTCGCYYIYISQARKRVAKISDRQTHAKALPTTTITQDNVYDRAIIET